MSLSIIIPAYNEQDGIAPVIIRLCAIVPDAEIIVVDDGSSDGTGEVARAAGAKVLRHPANAGYGRSLKTGILQASHELIAIMDADGTYPAESLPVFLGKMTEGFDMVVGARHGSHYWGTFLKMPARLVFKFLVEFATGKHIPDINSGMRVFRKSDAIALLPHLCDVYSFTTTMTLAYCFRRKFIAYVPIDYAKRIGRSKVRIVRDSLRTLQYIVESIAFFNPLKLFLLLTFFLLMLAIGFAVAGWLMPASSAGLIAAGAFLCSILTFALGIHADIFRKRS